jgi:tetratricopeptide (TPR) repeat protein
MLVFESLLAQSDDAVAANEFIEAANYLRRARNRCPHRLEPLERMAELALRRNNLAEAKALAEELIAEHPKRYQPVLLKARVLDAQGDSQRATKLLDECLKKHPHEPEPYLTLAAIHSRRGHHREALAYLRRATKLAPKRADILRLAGWAALRCRDTRAALAYAMDSFPLAPEVLDSHLLLIRAQVAEERLPAAQTLLEKAVVRLGPQPALWQVEADLALAQEQPARAHKALIHLTAGQPDDPAPWTQRAEVEMKLKAPHDAIASLTHALQLAPATCERTLLMGQALEAIEQLPEAAEAYRRAYQLDEAAWQPCFRLGLLLTKLPGVKSAQEAAVQFDMAACLAPQAERWEPMAYLSWALFHLGSEKMALRAAKQALAEGPKRHLAIARLEKMLRLKRETAVMMHPPTPPAEAMAA